MMRRFLIAGQLDGRPGALAKLRALAQERRPDGVLLTGGLLRQGSLSHAERLKKWEECLKELGELGVFTALVPGAQDVPLREFLRLAKDAEAEYPTLHVAQERFRSDNAGTAVLRRRNPKPRSCSLREDSLSYKAYGSYEDDEAAAR